MFYLFCDISGPIYSRPWLNTQHAFILLQIWVIFIIISGEYLGFWFKSPWGDCSVTCGKGALSRAIACVNHASTGILEESQCPIEKPISYQVCTKQKCPVQYSWFVGEWKKVWLLSDSVIIRLVGYFWQKSHYSYPRLFYQFHGYCTIIYFLLENTRLAQI